MTSFQEVLSVLSLATNSTNSISNFSEVFNLRTTLDHRKYTHTMLYTYIKPGLKLGSNIRAHPHGADIINNERFKGFIARSFEELGIGLIL